jgi:hypothetical protein
MADYYKGIINNFGLFFALGRRSSMKIRVKNAELNINSF